MAVTRLHIDQCLTRLQIRRLGLKEHPQSSTESYCHTAQRRATLTAITAEGLGKQVFISVPYPDTGIFIHSAHGSSWMRTSDCEQEQAIPHMDWTTVWALCFTLTEKHVSVTSLLNSRNCVLSMIWCNVAIYHKPKPNIQYKFNCTISFQIIPLLNIWVLLHLYALSALWTFTVENTLS